MPSKSKKQHNFMAAAAHNPRFAKKAGIKSSVAKEYVAADKGRKFREGGMMGKMDAKVADYFAKKGLKSLAAHERREAAGKEEDSPAMAKKEMKALKGAPKSLKNYEKKEHKKKGYAKGGSVRGGGCASKGVGRGRFV